MWVIWLGAVLAFPFSFSPAQPARPSAWAPATGLRATRITDDLVSPLFVTSPAGDPRLFVVEQPGRIRIVRDGELRSAPFLDLSRRVSFGGERGLLGLAFHPDYARNGLFYVDFTDSAGDTRVERYHVSPRDPDAADPRSGRLVLRVAQPYANHNGGMIAFGPDGKLWIGMGDGGSGGDPHGNGQNPATLLGKLLRIDVDAGEPYRIPADNPFVARAGARPEIWALGMRNPWRFSFDRGSPTLVVGDVGQDRWEEIDVVDSRTPGLDFGWNVREGRHAYGAPRPAPEHLVEPLIDYPHDEGCSVTGGYVYRGRAIPQVRGAYFFSDYCKGWLRSLRWVGGRAADLRQWQVGTLGSVTSFGEDAAGELYVTTQEGRLYRLDPAR